MLNETVEKARAAQRAWGALPYRERAARLKDAARFLGGHTGEITAVIHEDNGKLPLDALAAEALPAALAINYYLKSGKRFSAPRPIRSGSLLMFNKRSRIVYSPWGVIGIISPWNYPFAIPFSEVVMALLAGNAVILKTASATPRAGRALAEVFQNAGLPGGLFSWVEMPGKEAGPAFIASGIDKLFFTGSSAVGRELMALAAPRLLPLVLELGGADAAIICADADIERAAGGVVWAGFSNAGQSCGGVQRVLVNRAIYTEFERELCARVRSLRPGRGMESDLGPMTSARQRETVQAQVAACLEMGASIAAQSPAAPPDAAGEDAEAFFPATVLTGVTPAMPIMKEEVFGPVVALIPVESDEEAVRIANESTYALTGSVWSRSRAHAKRAALGLNAGAITLNDHLMSHGLAETPWGGFGESGIGRTHGEEGFREMLKARVIVDDILPGVKRDIWWQPYSESVYRGIRAITALASRGVSAGEKLRALPAVLRIFLRYWGR